LAGDVKNVHMVVVLINGLLDQVVKIIQVEIACHRQAPPDGRLGVPESGDLLVRSQEEATPSIRIGLVLTDRLVDVLRT